MLCISTKNIQLSYCHIIMMFNVLCFTHGLVGKSKFSNNFPSERNEIFRMWCVCVKFKLLLFKTFWMEKILHRGIPIFMVSVLFFFWQFTCNFFLFFTSSVLTDLTRHINIQYPLHSTPHVFQTAFIAYIFLQNQLNAQEHREWVIESPD